ncbi:MAG: hypothetical protein IKU29_02895 [Parabacteroides sp.]|nr:hypothetical protein [Parabacteroides sp.]
MNALEQYEFEPLEELNEQEEFLRILYHDKRGGNAIRMTMGQDPDGQPYVRHFGSVNLDKISYHSTRYNAYVTVNAFRGYRRVTSDVYCYQAIFIDLDGHNFASEEKLERACERTKERLRKAFATGEITAPTMITATGRGLGVFYVLENSIANQKGARKSIKYLSDVRKALMEKYRQILSGKGYLNVDTTTKDAARVCRMPLTYNKNAKRWCRLVFINRDEEGDVKYCHLKQLAADNHLFDSINEVKKQMISRKIVQIDAYRLPFLTIRLQKIEMLQELRNYDCSGYREYMAFIYYNAAKQVYGELDGRRLVEAFNGRFKEPLGEDEVQHLINVTDGNEAITGDYKGFYKLPDRWIIETLEVTESENEKCKFGASKREIERQNVKAEHAKARAERDQAIQAAILEHPELTYKQIGVQYGVSESTVRRIAKNAELHRYKEKEVSENNEGNIVLMETSNVQKMSESLLGVSSALLTSYRELYSETTIQRRNRQQLKGQLSFRVGPDGMIDYYMIS